MLESFCQGMEVSAVVLCEFMHSKCLHLVCKNIHQKNQEKIHPSGLLTRSGTWSHWSLFSMEAEAMADANEVTHESVYMGATHVKRCIWHMMQKWHRKETQYGCKFCDVQSSKKVATLHTITSSSSILKIFIFFKIFFIFFAHLKVS